MMREGAEAVGRSSGSTTIFAIYRLRGGLKFRGGTQGTGIETENTKKVHSALKEGSRVRYQNGDQSKLEPTPGSGHMERSDNATG